MTDMDYEKKYNEALKDMRAIYPNLKGDAKLAVEHAFPELAESEDERIRKEIIDHLVKEVGLYPGEDRKEHKWLRWIEKQDLRWAGEIHKNGYNLCKEQMLKDAVEGYVGKDGILTLSNGEAVDLSPSLDKIAFGLQPSQKVRIVVLKEEEEE